MTIPIKNGNTSSGGVLNTAKEMVEVPAAPAVDTSPPSEKTDAPTATKNRDRDIKDRIKVGHLFSNPFDYNKTIKVDVKVYDSPGIYISTFLEDVCLEIQEMYPGLEFSILAKSQWGKDGLVVTDEYVVPKQRVGYANVNYEPLGQYVAEGYDICIHSHHNLGCGFSGTDMRYINSFFKGSILFAKGQFVSAQILYDVPRGYARYDAPVVMYRSRPVVDRGLIRGAIRQEGTLDKVFNALMGPADTFKKP